MLIAGITVDHAMIVGCFVAYFNMHWDGIFVDCLKARVYWCWKNLDLGLCAMRSPRSVSEMSVALSSLDAG